MNSPPSTSSDPNQQATMTERDIQQLKQREEYLLKREQALLEREAKLQARERELDAKESSVGDNANNFLTSPLENRTRSLSNISTVSSASFSSSVTGFPQNYSLNSSFIQHSNSTKVPATIPLIQEEKNNRDNPIIKLNVGGKIFQTRLESLQKEGDNFFSALFGGNFAVEVDEDGTFFIDRDPKFFELILNYMRGYRYVETVIPKLDDIDLMKLAEDIDFYQINPLKDIIPFFFTPGTMIMSGCVDRSIKFWNWKQKVCAKSFTGHTNSVYALLLLNDTQFASGSGDNSIKIWNMETGVCVHTFLEHTGCVKCLCKLSNGLLASGADDKQIIFWNLKQLKREKKIAAHGEEVKNLIEIQPGKLVSCSIDRTIKVWDINSGECLNSITASTSYINCMDKLDDKHVLIGGGEKIVKIFNIETGQCVSTLMGHSGAIWNLVLMSPKILVTVGTEPSIRIWDLETKECTRIISHSRKLLPICKISDKLVACGEYTEGDGGAIHVYNIITGDNMATLHGHTHSIRSLIFVK